MLEPDSPTAVSRPRRGLTVVAWLVILGVVAAHMVLPSVVEDESSGPDVVDAAADVVSTIQGRYLVGAAQFVGGDTLYIEAQQLNQGGIDQRLRFVVLAGELAGAKEATEQLESLDTLIDEHRDHLAEQGEDWSPSERQQSIIDALQALYGTGTDAPDPARLTETSRTRLREQLGWFGDLALAPKGTVDTNTREAVVGPARTSFVLIVGVIGIIGVAGFAGFIGLVILIVFAAVGRLRSGVIASAMPHGVYAETFAIWMVVFLAGQFAAGAIGQVWPSVLLPGVFVAFFASLLTLAWPIIRGGSWKEVRRDIGWTLGPRPWAEPFVAVGAYAMALPIVAIGLLMTFLLMAAQMAFAGEVAPLEPVTSPAHPVILELADGNLWMLFQVLMLGSVAAPVIEETMFRGVLYRHLRDASRGVAVVASVAIATIVNAFVFAIIHPQGWLAVPALMSLAVAFSLVREWRGTVVTCMIMHGLSNAIVLGLVGGLLSL